MCVYGMGSKGLSPWRRSEDFEFLKKEDLWYRDMKRKGNSVDQEQTIKENSEEGVQMEKGGECTELKPEVNEHGEAWKKTTGRYMKGWS